MFQPCVAAEAYSGEFVLRLCLLGAMHLFYPDKGALAWYGKLTWESAHAWNLIILCLVIVWGMTFIFMVHLSFYAIPLLNYDVMYGITTIP